MVCVAGLSNGFLFAFNLELALVFGLELKSDYLALELMSSFDLWG